MGSRRRLSGGGGAGPLEVEAVRRTDALLQRLPASEWTVVCDERWRNGVDHVIVGPPGVFALASRQPDGVGAARVKDGMLWLRRGSDPRRDRAGVAINRSALESARVLRRELRARDRGGEGEGRGPAPEPEVQPVVVLWCEFPQAVAEGSRIAFVRGLDLLDWISSRPRRLDPAGCARLGDAVRLLANDGGHGGHGGRRIARNEPGAVAPAPSGHIRWRRLGGRRAA